MGLDCTTRAQRTDQSATVHAKRILGIIAGLILKTLCTEQVGIGLLLSV